MDADRRGGPGASPAATAGFDLLGDFRTMMGINANLPGTTVVRVRGALQFNLTAAPGATSGVLLGARVSSIEGLGPASPLPSSSPSEDWMMFDWAPLSMGWAGGSIVGTDTFSYALDIKSKRRLDEAQETIGLWAEATRDADTFSLYGWVSVLVALP